MKIKKYSTHLCPKCKISENSYLLDNKNPFCKYLRLHTGKSCPKFKKSN